MKPMTIRFEETLYEKIKKQAEDRGMNIAEFVRKTMRDAVENDQIYPVWGTLGGE